MKDMKDNKQELSAEKMENVSGGGWEQVVPVVIDVAENLVGSGGGDDSQGAEKDSTNFTQDNSNNSGIQLITQEGDSVNNGDGGIVLNQQAK